MSRSEIYYLLKNSKKFHENEKFWFLTSFPPDDLPPTTDEDLGEKNSENETEETEKKFCPKRKKN